MTLITPDCFCIELHPIRLVSVRMDDKRSLYRGYARMGGEVIRPIRVSECFCVHCIGELDGRCLLEFLPLFILRLCKVFSGFNSPFKRSYKASQFSRSSR